MRKEEWREGNKSERKSGGREGKEESRFFFRGDEKRDETSKRGQSWHM